MKIFLAGATGATGRLLVEMLLRNGHSVRLIVRSLEGLSSTVRDHAEAEIREASLLDLDDAALAGQVGGCDAVVSCLGHNMSFKGIYGKPRRLVTVAAGRLCSAIKSIEPSKPIKYILMNTTGNLNREEGEKASLGEAIILQLLRWLVPPHPDNEQAARFLQQSIGQSDPSIEWVAVRPDSLLDENEVSNYSLHASLRQSPLFGSGKTSRINVADFMRRLIEEPKLWHEWKGQMPAIYNVPDA